MNTLPSLNSKVRRQFPLTEIAQRPFISPLSGWSRVTPEMALRLSKAIGRTPESWLVMQDHHDLWLARKSVNLQSVGKLKLAAA